MRWTPGEIASCRGVFRGSGGLMLLAFAAAAVASVGGVGGVGDQCEEKGGKGELQVAPKPFPPKLRHPAVYIVTASDGKLVGIDSATGHVLWSISTGGNLVSRTGDSPFIPAYKTADCSTLSSETDSVDFYLKEGDILRRQGKLDEVTGQPPNNVFWAAKDVKEFEIDYLGGVVVDPEAETVLDVIRHDITLKVKQGGEESTQTVGNVNVFRKPRPAHDDRDDASSRATYPGQEPESGSKSEIDAATGVPNVASSQRPRDASPRLVATAEGRLFGVDPVTESILWETRLPASPVKLHKVTPGLVEEVRILLNPLSQDTAIDGHSLLQQFALDVTHASQSIIDDVPFLHTLLTPAGTKQSLTYSAQPIHIWDKKSAVQKLTIKPRPQLPSASGDDTSHARDTDIYDAFDSHSRQHRSGLSDEHRPALVHDHFGQPVDVGPVVRFLVDTELLPLGSGGLVVHPDFDSMVAEGQAVTYDLASYLPASWHIRPLSLVSPSVDEPPGFDAAGAIPAARENESTRRDSPNGSADSSDAHNPSGGGKSDLSVVELPGALPGRLKDPKDPVQTGGARASGLGVVWVFLGGVLTAVLLLIISIGLRSNTAIDLFKRKDAPTVLSNLSSAVSAPFPAVSASPTLRHSTSPSSPPVESPVISHRSTPATAPAQPPPAGLLSDATPADEVGACPSAQAHGAGVSGSFGITPEASSATATTVPAADPSSSSGSGASGRLPVKKKPSRGGGGCEKASVSAHSGPRGSQGSRAISSGAGQDERCSEKSKSSGAIEGSGVSSQDKGAKESVEVEGRLTEEVLNRVREFRVRLPKGGKSDRSLSGASSASGSTDSTSTTTSTTSSSSSGRPLRGRVFKSPASPPPKPAAPSKPDPARRLAPCIAVPTARAKAAGASRKRSLKASVSNTRPALVPPPPPPPDADGGSPVFTQAGQDTSFSPIASYPAPSSSDGTEESTGRKLTSRSQGSSRTPKAGRRPHRRSPSKRDVFESSSDSTGSSGDCREFGARTRSHRRPPSRRLSRGVMSPITPSLKPTESLEQLLAFDPMCMNLEQQSPPISPAAAPGVVAAAEPSPERSVSSGDTADENRSANAYDDNSTYRGNYTELRNIGSGGYGSLWLAENKTDKKMYAVKKVRLRDEDNEEAVEENSKTKREASMHASLDHPNIARYNWSWEEDLSVSETLRVATQPDDGCSASQNNTLLGLAAANPKKRCKHLFIAMKYYSEGSLRDWLLRRYELNRVTNTRLLLQLAEGLSHLHHNEVLHRDMKPSNILVEKLPKGKHTNTQLKICDFGLSVVRRNNDWASATMNGSHDMPTDVNTTGVAGTPLYSPPENSCKSAPYGKHSDIFSLGVIYYELYVFPHPTTSSEKIRHLGILGMKDRRLPEHLLREFPDEMQLVLDMTNLDYNMRPSLKQIKKRAKLILKNYTKAKAPSESVQQRFETSSVRSVPSAVEDADGSGEGYSTDDESSEQTDELVRLRTNTESSSSPTAPIPPPQGGPWVVASHPTSPVQPPDYKFSAAAAANQLSPSIANMQPIVSAPGGFTPNGKSRTPKFLPSTSGRPLLLADNVPLDHGSAQELPFYLQHVQNSPSVVPLDPALFPGSRFKQVCPMRRAHSYNTLS
ncbi:eIF-2-alpha kinase GCN2 [Diplonema papillatum]|nr:eIF-2-alpha kinase GCN2 [Diplonema papillatum]